MIISALYILLFILSVNALYVLIRFVANKRASYYVVLFTLITIVCLAYFAYSFASNEGMALVANQFTYLDGSFILVFFLFCVLDICGIRVKKRIGIPLILIGLGILALAFTTGKSELMYKSIELRSYAGATYLSVEFGPVHKYFLAYVVLNTLAPVGIVIYSFFIKRKFPTSIPLLLGYWKSP